MRGLIAPALVGSVTQTLEEISKSLARYRSRLASKGSTLCTHGRAKDWSCIIVFFAVDRCRAKDNQFAAFCSPMFPVRSTMCCSHFAPETGRKRSECIRHEENQDVEVSPARSHGAPVDTITTLQRDEKMSIALMQALCVCLAKPACLWTSSQTNWAGGKISG